MKNKFIYFLFAAVVAASCTKDREPDIILEKAEYKNVSYGADTRHQMDVYLPKGRDEQTPVVVLIHGGAWIEGKKEDMSFVQEALNISPFNNFAFITLNYRLASETVHFDDMLGDIAQALETVKEKSGEWGIRDRNFTLLGVSSGAHLALLYAYGVQQPGEAKSVISIAGPTDLTTLTTNPAENIALAQWLLGIPFPDFENPRYPQASPLYQVDKAVPTLLIHGTIDDVVPYEQSVSLKAALDSKSITNKLVTLEGVGHNLDNVNPQIAIEVFGEISTWIKTHRR